MPDVLDMFKQGLKEARRQQKSDEIVTFIRAHWKFFCQSRASMDTLCEELEQHQDLSPTALADALGLPSCLVFKRVKVVDTAKTILHPLKSALFKLFLEQVEKRGKVCLLAVAGEHSFVITNLKTERVPGLVHISVPDVEGVGDVSIFLADDAPYRLPSVFLPGV